jgi:hypothetical protein
MDTDKTTNQRIITDEWSEIINREHVRFTEEKVTNGFEYIAFFAKSSKAVPYYSKDRLKHEEVKQEILKMCRLKKEGKQFGR